MVDIYNCILISQKDSNPISKHDLPYLPICMAPHYFMFHAATQVSIDQSRKKKKKVSIDQTKAMISRV
jgi:hypothetical protein